MQQTPGKNNYAALAVVVVVIAAALAGAMVFSSSDDDDGGGEASGPPPAPGMPGAEDGGEGGGDLKVVEQGFSNYTLGTGEDASAFGIVVENTGDDVFNDAFVEVAAYSPSDEVLWESEFRTGILRPGERIGFGDELWDSEVVDPIAKLGIGFPDEGDHKIDDPPEGAFVSSAPTTETGTLGHITTFSISSTYTYNGAAGGLATIGAIYRDAAGKIIGGAKAQAMFAGETADAELRTFTAIPDVAATEVFAAPTGLIE